MVNEACRQCGQSIRAQDAFCGKCGAKVSTAAIGSTGSSTDLFLEGAPAVEAPPTEDGGRWQWTRAVLGLGSVVLASLIALSLLGGFGDGGADGDATTINETEEASTETDDPTTVPTSTPLPQPKATGTPPATPRSDESDADADHEDDGSTDDLIAGWSEVTDLYDGGGVLALQLRRSEIHLVDLATGRWQAVEVPGSSLGRGFTPYASFPLRAGVVSVTGTRPTFRAWDSTEPEPIGEVGQMVLGRSEDVVILGDDQGLFFGGGGTSLLGLEVATGRFGAGALAGVFGSLSYPFAAELGDGVAVWTIDDGWTDLGAGNVLATSAGGLVVQICEVVDDGLTCAMETVALDGTRTEVHPDVSIPQLFGTSASPDLRFVAAWNWPESGLPGNTYVVTDLRTGTSVDGGPIEPGSFFNGGAWLGDSAVFASIGSRSRLQLTDAATGQAVVIDDVPWPRASTPMNPSESLATWIDMPFPEPLPAAE